MPELPEVTTTTQGLNETVKGKYITDIWSGWKKQIKHPGYRAFRNKVVGAKIIQAKRVGKNILIELDNGNHILVHMKMTGHFLYGDYEYKKGKWIAIGEGPLRDDPRNQFLHLVFHLSDKKQLVLSDMRKFAKVKLVVEENPLEHEDLINLGPDALDVKFNDFYKIINSKSKTPIKKVLLNQELIAGIGNIYSDESLFLAGIHPESHSGAISKPRLRKLYDSLREILKKGIKLSGDSDSDYRNIYGLPGNMQKHHKVYRRKGEICSKKSCGGVIRRIVVGGRGTHFCPKHQKQFKID